MFKVNKTSEPEFFTNFKRHHPMSNWDGYGAHPEIKQKLREHMLIEEQDLCCPYCEIEIDINSSEIEHIKPKGKPEFRGLFQNYDNFLTACKTPKICGNSKGNQWSEHLIDPTLEDPMDYFTYDIKTGDLVPKFSSGTKYEKAKITIDILNLNHSRLREMRKTFILQNINNLDYIDYNTDFPTLRKFLKESVI